jgi:hypothetical protein
MIHNAAPKSIQLRIQQGVNSSPELHLTFVEHIACLLNEPVPDLHVFSTLLIAKVCVVHFT